MGLQPLQTPDSAGACQPLCLRSVTRPGEGLRECYLVALVPEELNRWIAFLSPLSWRGEETGKGFVLVLHQTTGNLSAAGLGPGEVVPVPSTALGMLPLKIPQWLEKIPSEQTKERKIHNVAQ